VVTRLLDRLGREAAARDRFLASGAGDPYPDAVVREELRLHPPARAALCRLTAPLAVTGHSLSPGTTVMLPILQRDPAAFAAPDESQPERWLAVAHRSATCCRSAAASAAVSASTWRTRTSPRSSPLSSGTSLCGPSAPDQKRMVVRHDARAAPKRHRDGRRRASRRGIGDESNLGRQATRRLERQAARRQRRRRAAPALKPLGERRAGRSHVG
jgi:hypothetical protein